MRLSSHILFIFYISAVKSNVLSKEVFQYENLTNSKAEYAFEVVNKICSSFKQWFFTISFCEFTYFENRILKYTQENGFPVLLINSCPYSDRVKVKPKIDKHGLTTYLVTSEELSTDISDYVIEALIRTEVFKPRSSLIFVLSVPVKVDSYFFFNIRSHFQLLWTRSITNSILIIWDVDENHIQAYTYNPFYDQVREVTDVGSLTKLLSKQYENLYGYELKVSVFKKIRYDDDEDPINCDSRLVKTLIKKFNATCRPLATRDGDTVGDILDNGTSTGQTADLVDGYADIELNSRILKNSYYGYIDTTYPFIQDQLCFVVRKSSVQSTFTTTLKLISTSLLIIFSCNVVLLIALALVVRKVERKVFNLNDKQATMSTLMDLIKCFIRQTVDIKFTGPLFRFVILMIIVYSLIVDCVIDGIITSAITYPRYTAEMDSITDIANSNLTLGIQGRQMSMFNRSLFDEDREKLQGRIIEMNDIKIKKFFEKREFQYAVLLRKSDAKYLTQRPENMEAGRPLFHTIRDCPLDCSIVYGLRFGSPYLTRVNNILHHLNQGGILQYWLQAEEAKPIKLNAEDGKEKKALNMLNLKEIFWVFAVGVGLSSILVILEILTFKYSNRVLVV